MYVELQGGFMPCSAYVALPVLSPLSACPYGVVSVTRMLPCFDQPLGFVSTHFFGLHLLFKRVKPGIASHAHSPTFAFRVVVTADLNCHWQDKDSTATYI